MGQLQRLMQWGVLVASVSGCVATPERVSMEEVANGTAVIIMADAVVIHDSTLGEPVLRLEDNKAVAYGLAATAEAEFRRLGYEVAASSTVSVALSPASPEKVLLEQVNEGVAVKATSTERPIFLDNPNGYDQGGIDLIYRVAALQGQISPSAEAPRALGDQAATTMGSFGGSMLAVLSGSGRYISGGQIAGNVAKGMLTVVAGLGGSSTSSGMDMAHDTATLALKVYEQGTGRLIWQGELTINGNPTAENLTQLLGLMMTAMPARRGHDGKR